MSKITSYRDQCFRKTIISNSLRLVLILTFLAGVFLPRSLYAYDFQGCKNCHAATLEGDTKRQFFHPSFANGECGECHATSAASAPKDLSVSQIDPKEITWLVESMMRDTSHGYVLPADKLSDTLLVELTGVARESFRQLIAVPSIGSLTEVEDSGKPPNISELQVLKVERRILVSVTIGWKTDTLTNASVRYGIEGLTEAVGPTKRLAIQHQVLLPGLQSDKTYHFSVIAKDLFGRSQTSKPLTFSTSNPVIAPIAPPPENLNNSQSQGNAIGITASFKRFGSDYLIELTVQKPAEVSIGAIGPPRCLPDDNSHVGLSCGMELTIDTCLSCHKPHGHPLNVSPEKPGIIIPQGFPTLPGGRITCVSCHNPHSSEYAYLARRKGDSELCASCHRKKMN